MTTLIGPRGGPATPIEIDLPVADGLCDFSKLKDVDLSGADLDLGFEKPRSETRVVAAMSGGVDSSVVATLLKYAGYDVIGVTLQLYDHGAALKKQGACCAGQDIHDARRVAEALGIPHYVLDYESRFRQQVMEDFADTYLKGSTPIPCVRCNQTVKFKDLLATAREEGLLVGGSAGTNVVAALRVAARGDVDGPVVTVLPDGWDRYRAQPWMRAWGE